MKGTYLRRILYFVEQAKNATRTTTFKAAVAHIYGEVSIFQNDCCLDCSLDGDNSEGQMKAIVVEKTALKLLNAEPMDVPQHIDAFYRALDALIVYLKS